MRKLGVMFLGPLFVLGTACLCATSDATSFPPTNGIPNFAVVDELKRIYRGGQPTAEGWAYLKSIGVTNVVKLNTDDEASDAPGERLGMTICKFAMTARQQLLGTTVQQKVKAAADHITANTFVHCKLGKNRTGTVIGYYRITRCGWTKGEARKEMNQYGWRDSLPGLQLFWRLRAAEANR